jgi:hypothetical protein
MNMIVDFCLFRMRRDEESRKRASNFIKIIFFFEKFPSPRTILSEKIYKKSREIHFSKEKCHIIYIFFSYSVEKFFVVMMFVW